MSDEQKQQLTNILRWLLIGVFAYLYSQGGMEGGGGIWIRRYQATVVLGVGCFLLSRNWRYLAVMPLSMGAFTLGYGSDVLWMKVLKRLYCGLAYGVSSGGRLILDKIWAAFAPHMIFCVTGSVAFGAFNPFHSARIEEFAIGVCIAFIPVMSAERQQKTPSV